MDLRRRTFLKSAAALLSTTALGAWPSTAGQAKRGRVRRQAVVDGGVPQQGAVVGGVPQQGAVDGGSTEDLSPEQIVAWGLPVMYFGNTLGVPAAQLSGNPDLVPGELERAKRVLQLDRRFRLHFRAEPHVYLPPSFQLPDRIEGFQWSWVKGLPPGDWWADLGVWTGYGYRIAPRAFSLIGGTDDGMNEWSRQAELVYAATGKYPAFYGIARDDVMELQPTRWIMDLANVEYQQWYIDVCLTYRSELRGGTPFFVVKSDRLGMPQTRRLWPFGHPLYDGYREPGMPIRTPYQGALEWETAVASFISAIPLKLKPAVAEHPRAGELPETWFAAFGIADKIAYAPRPWLAHEWHILNYLDHGSPF